MSDDPVPAEPGGRPPPPVRGPLGTPGSATASLLLGIAGLLVCPVICSIAAIALGYSAKRRIDANHRYQGRGVAQTGIVLGVIGLAFWAIFFLIGLAGLVGIGNGIPKSI